MRSRGFPRAQPEGTPETERYYFPVLPDSSQSYRHYPIYKIDEALVIAIAIAMSRAIAMSKPRAKKETNQDFFLVWLNNDNNNSFNLGKP